MDLQDMLNKTLDVASTAVNGAKDVANKASTAAYKKSNELKDTVSSSMKGTRKIEEQQQRTLSKYDRAMDKLTNNQFDPNNIVEEDIENTDPNDIDALQKNYDDIKEGVYSNTEFKGEEKVGTEIKRWLEANYNEKPKDQITIESTLNKKRKNFENQPFRIDMGQYLLEQYQTNKLRFADLTKSFNENPFHRISNETARRLAIMEDVLRSYAGDMEAMLSVDDECTVSAKESKTFSRILKNYLEGRSTIEQCSQNLFFELHGVDTTKLSSKELSNKEIVNLCVLQELGAGLNAIDFIEHSPEQVNILISVANTGNIGFKDLDFTAKYYTLGCIDKTFRNQDMEAITIQHGTDVGLDLVFEYNNAIDCVDIFQYEGIKETHLATCNQERNFTKGSLQLVTDIFKQNDNLTDFIENSEIGELQNHINALGNVMHKEALDNKMTETEKQAYIQAENDAIAEAIARHGAPPRSYDE